MQAVDADLAAQQFGEADIQIDAVDISHHPQGGGGILRFRAGRHPLVQAHVAGHQAVQGIEGQFANRERDALAFEFAAHGILPPAGKAFARSVHAEPDPQPDDEQGRPHGKTADEKLEKHGSYQCSPVG